MDQILSSAYILGSTQEQLNQIYDVEGKSLESWKDAPGEISKDDWREFIGQKQYQRAYVDFFEDRLAQHGYDWKDLLNGYLFGGKEPLVNNLICGLAHPLIHLGYGFEMSSPTIIVEALALATCCYNDQHKYLDNPAYSQPGKNPTTKLTELLSNISNDTRFEDAVNKQNGEGYDALFADPDKEALLLEYWNNWDLSNPKQQFEDSQKAAAAMLVGTPTKRNPRYDFFLVHVLTSSHAVRILLPLIPSKWHVSLVRQWWLFALSAYVMEFRPAVDLERVEKFDLRGRSWDYVLDKALNSEWATDAHFVKGCRSLKVAADTWGDDDQFYLKAAVRFAEEFNHWGGASY
ncbi:hypothetical protein ANO11243_089790 [Dothideomycetidae sp. 11243]|nr:hypothetical protein ANO11243_089790 [fungal sp. No.11243]